MKTDYFLNKIYFPRWRPITAKISETNEDYRQLDEEMQGDYRNHV